MKDKSGAAISKGETWTEYIIDAPTKDSKNGECSLEGSGGIICCSCLDLTTASHASQGIEHSRAAETDQTYQANLDKGLS